MIKVQDWIASIPDEEKHIAYVGEGKSEQREFLLCGNGWEQFSNFNFHLDMAFDPTSITTRDSRQVVQTTHNSTENKEEATVTVDEVTTKETYTVENVQVTNNYLTDVAPLSRKVTTDGIRLTWDILRQHTVLPGKLWATIRAVDGETQRIKKSAIMVFEVDPSVAATPAAMPPVSEMEQIEMRMNTLCQFTQLAADEAEEHVATATSAADTAIRSATTATIAADGALGNMQKAVDAANAAEQNATIAHEAANVATGAKKSALSAVDQCNNYAHAAEQAAIAAEESRQAINEEELKDLDRRVGDAECALFGAESNTEPIVETITVNNLVTNSQLANGTTGWSLVDTTASMEVVDGVLRVFDLQTANCHLRHRFTNQSAFVTGHRYYHIALAKYDGGNFQTGKTASLTLTGSNTHESTYSTPRIDAPDGEWRRKSGITTLVEDKSSNYYSVWATFAADGRDAVNVYVDHAIVIDLTATFGEGNEPDGYTMDRWMQEQYPDGFEGTATLALTPEDSGEDGEDKGLVGKVEVLEGAVADLAESMNNLPMGELVQTGTVYPVLEPYYIDNIEEARPAYYNAQEANALTFTMLADIHIHSNSNSAYTSIAKNVEASSVWSKLVNNDFIMLGGDLIVDYHDKPTALGLIDDVVEMAEKYARCPVYAVKGNHDTNEGVSADIPEYRLTDKEFYLHANARGEKYGMVTDPAHPYGSYYYVDFPKQKIRMVCLNTSENNANYDILTSTKSQFRYIGVFSPNQMAWIKDIALRVDEGWAVMMVSHIPPFQAENFENRGTSNPNLRALCEAFAAGTGDFAEQGAREFIGHFSGHAHIDAYNEIGGLNYVLVNCTTPQKRWDISLDRTKDEDKLSLNSFIVDRATRTVKCIKIGAKPDENYGGDWVDRFTWKGVTAE